MYREDRSSEDETPVQPRSLAEKTEKWMLQGRSLFDMSHLRDYSTKGVG